MTVKCQYSKLEAGTLHCGHCGQCGRGPDCSLTYVHYFGVNDADLHLLMFSFKSQWSDAAEATDERTDKQTDKQTDG